MTTYTGGPILGSMKNVKRNIESLEAAGREIATHVLSHRTLTRGIQDDIRSRACSLGYTSAITGDVNRIVLAAAEHEIGLLLSVEVG